MPQFPVRVAEMTLAHAVGKEVKSTYRRGDLLTEWRWLTDAWSDFGMAPIPAGEVAPIRRAAP
jgi:hypothetical protein